MKLTKKAAVKLFDLTPIEYLLSALCLDWLVCFILLRQLAFLSRAVEELVRRNF